MSNVVSINGNEDIFRGFGVEVNIAGSDDFLKIKETLTRIGVPRNSDKTLFQSCHILHKQGRYAIMHFKEMFAFDNKYNNVSEEDIARRNKIVKMLAEWGMLKELDPAKTERPIAYVNRIKVLPYSERNEWTLETKYRMGTKVEVKEAA